MVQKMSKKHYRISIMMIISILIFSFAFAEPAYAAGGTINASTRMIRNGNDHWDIATLAGHRQYGYDTIQGACSNNGIAYMALYNRDRGKIEIAKVDLATMKVLRVSSPLPASAHGNTLTYNTRTNKIIAVCGKEAKKNIVIFDPNTMSQVGTKTISVSKKKLKQKFGGINGLSYNAAKNVYVLKVRNNSGKFVILDSNFKVKKVIKPKGVRKDLLSQGIYTEGNYVYDLQSFKGKNRYNLITVRKLSNGKVVKRIKVYSGNSGQLYELENLFHDRGKWYISYYRANVRPQGDTDRKNYLYTVENM
jgi:hypothetical protein